METKDAEESTIYIPIDEIKDKCCEIKTNNKRMIETRSSSKSQVIKKKKTGPAKKALIIGSIMADECLIAEEINVWKMMLEEEYNFDSEDIFTLFVRNEKEMKDEVEQKITEFLKCRSGDSLVLIYCSDNAEESLSEVIIRVDMSKLPRGAKLTAILDASSESVPFGLNYGLQCSEKTSSYDLYISDKVVQADVTCFTRNIDLCSKLLSGLRQELQNNNYETSHLMLLSQMKGLRIWFSRIKTLDTLFDFIK